MTSAHLAQLLYLSIPNSDKSHPSPSKERVELAQAQSSKTGKLILKL